MFITKTELKLYFNSRIILSVIILTLLSLVVGLLSDKMLYMDRIIPKFNLLVVDNDKSIESDLLTKSLKFLNADVMEVRLEENDAAIRRVENNEAAAAVVLPKNFFKDIMSGKNSNAGLVVNNQNGIVGEMIALFAGSLKEELSAAQAGIYSVLSYADEKNYNALMTESNIAFLSVFMARDLESHLVTPFGAVSNTEYYSFCFYLFMMFLLSCLFVEKGNIIKSGPLLSVLLSKGISKHSVLAHKLLSVLIVYSAMNLPVMALMYFGKIFEGIGLSGLMLLFALLTICQSAFCFLAVWLFSDIKTAGIFIFIFQLALLFFSGGIVPLVFLPDAISRLSFLTPNYYITRLFISVKTGSIDGYMLFFSVCFILAMLAGSYIAASSKLRRAGGF